ncbi:hypothetical protein [Actinomycetospora sp.]|jgi:hypothetical protein|uniref:hypothetical protein n=1 Tax=Actinomycetospora sp. TaxID=1872135 RepID=UPI002F3F16ED
MGRHTRPDDDTATAEPGPHPRLIVTMRPVNPRPPLTASTTVVTPAAAPPPARGVLGPTPGTPPSPVIEPIGPPAAVGWRGRRAGRRQQAEVEALAARIARAQRRARQVSLSGAPAPAAAAVPVPTPRPAQDARPPWRSELPAPRESSA